MKPHKQSLHAKLKTVGEYESIILFDGRGYEKLMREIGSIQNRSTSEVKSLKYKKAECIINGVLKVGVCVLHPVQMNDIQTYEQGYKTAEEDFFNQYGGLINEHRK